MKLTLQETTHLGYRTVKNKPTGHNTTLLHPCASLLSSPPPHFLSGQTPYTFPIMEDLTH